jgi:hypothetical protein
MSIPSPLQQYHFHFILIWWHSPFKVQQVIGIAPASSQFFLLSPQSYTFYGVETWSWQEGTRRFGPMLLMCCSHRPHPLASPCAGRKLLVSSCFWKWQYSPLFLPSQEVGGGGVQPCRVHCCQIVENTTRNLKYRDRRKLFMARNWRGKRKVGMPGWARRSRVGSLRILSPLESSCFRNCR